MEKSPDPVEAPSTESSRHRAAKRGASYWKRNLTRLTILLSVWFCGSYGVSILFVNQLDAFSFFGFPLGFWFAQQGSILLFLVLIVAYVVLMNRLDDEYARGEADEAESASDEEGTNP
jgi:putative solute:sodium symporter small subunit